MAAGPAHYYFTCPKKSFLKVDHVRAGERAREKTPTNRTNEQPKVDLAGFWKTSKSDFEAAFSAARPSEDGVRESAFDEGGNFSVAGIFFVGGKMLRMQVEAVIWKVK